MRERLLWGNSKTIQIPCSNTISLYLCQLKLLICYEQVDNSFVKMWFEHGSLLFCPSCEACRTFTIHVLVLTAYENFQPTTLMIHKSVCQVSFLYLRIQKFRKMVSRSKVAGGYSFNVQLRALLDFVVDEHLNKTKKVPAIKTS
jgi:hypothetical protein